MPQRAVAHIPGANMKEFTDCDPQKGSSYTSRVTPSATSG